MTTLIPEKDLMEWSGHKRREALVLWLKANRVPYLSGRDGRVCVTSDAINQPLNYIERDVQPDDIQFV